MLKRYPYIAMLLACVTLACAVVGAQEPPAAETGEQESGEAKVSRPVELDKIQWTDDNGLVIESVPLSEYYEMRNRAKGVDSESETREPKILSLIAKGNVKERGNNPFDKGRVDLTIRLKIALLTDHEDWVRVRLRLGQAALGTELDDMDAGRYRITFEAPEGEEGTTGKRGEYVLWIKGRGEATEEVTLRFSVPLSGIGQENRLVLSVPNAATTELTLTVPMEGAIGSVASGADLETKANGSEATDLILRGFQGDINLSWRHPDNTTSQVAPLLKADGMIRATAAGRRVEFDARLTVSVVNTPGRELTDFDVCLPPGAVLAQETDPKKNYTIKDVTPEDLKPGEGRIVRVLLRKPVTGQETAEVELLATSDAKAAINGQFPLAGFNVSNAFLQTGRIDICTRGDWEVRCHPGLGVRQTEKSDGVDSEHWVASFRYYEQPFALSARIFPKRERVSVEPQYHLKIESGIATVSSRLKYAVRGKETFELKVDLNGWEFDRIGPEPLVMAHEVDKSGTLVISLQEGAVNEEFELLLAAHRSIAPMEGSLVLSMPKPHASSVSSTELIVLPADNIDLREDREKMVGWEPQKVPPPASIDLPEIQQEPLYYRGETGEIGEAVFAATVSVREREIVAEISTEVGIAPSRASVNERLIFDIKYEPASELAIQVPEDLAVEYYLDGEVVDALPSEKTPTDEGLTIRKIVLSSPRQGRLELTAKYAISIHDLQPLASVPCVIPLIVPMDVAFAGHILEATVESGIGIWRGPGSPWQVRADETDYANASVTEFFAETPENRIGILVLQKDPDAFGSAVVPKAWIQTWMTDTQRRDRVVYQVESDRRHLKVFLPSDADTVLLRVLVDGKEVEAEVSDQSVIVDLGPEQNQRSHVLELLYLCESRPPRGSMQIELPHLGDDLRIRRLYWQLVLPVSEHVVSVPKDYTAEHEWDWNGAWWGRIPTKEQSDLEKWVGTKADEPIPEVTSRYLFSKFGPAETAEIATASRTWIVGGASGLALLVGLLLIYVPNLRHPLFGLVLVLVVAGSTIAWPGASLLFAQAAGIGLALALLGAVLYRGVARRRRRTMRRDMSSSVFERGSTQAQFGSSEVEVLRSTATEPDAEAVHTPER